MCTVRMATKHLTRSLYGLILVILFVSPAMLLSQGYFATVTGSLTDATGAALPGTKMTLVDKQKGFTFRVISNREGTYLFPSIPPGTYDLTAERGGFAKVERTGITVDVNAHVTADLKLKVATATETVEVQSQSSTLQTEDATTGQVVNRTFIENLPLTDRYVLDLVSLAPGVTGIDDQCNISCTGTDFVSNGGRPATADVLMDGASITNYEPNGGITQISYVPSIESVQEFKVQQSNFSAEFGFSGGSIINMITQSGTNVLHGSAYDFIRNTHLDANNWFNNLNDIPIPPDHRNNFGGTIGGPIIKDKLFFFGDYDGNIQSNAGTNQAGVPTLPERGGDFGEVCAANGGTFDATGLCTVPQGQIWDPYSGTYNSDLGGAVRSAFVPFNNMAHYSSPGNPNLNGTPFQLSSGPGNLIDPVAQKMMQLFPKPNIAGNAGDSGWIYDNFIASGSTLFENHQYDVKIDYRVTQANLLSVKYSQAWSWDVAYNCFGNYADPCAGGPNQNHTHLISIVDTHTFSPTLLLNTTFGFTRGTEKIFAYPPTGAGNVTDPLSTLGFPSYLNSENVTGVPSMFIMGGYLSAGSNSIGSNPYGNFKQGQDTGQLTIALTKQLGPQELKVGFEGRLHQMNYLQTNAPNGDFNFDQEGSSQCPNAAATCGGDAMATFMMGYPDVGGYYQIQLEPATQNYQYAGYFQDNWKATKDLTLNVGMRYDISLPRTDRFNRQNWFDPNAVSPLQVPGLGQLTGGEVFASSRQRTITDTDWKDIQPRFGLAFKVNPRTVIRGGYGIYFAQTRSGANGVGSYGTQGFTQSTNLVTTYQNDGATPYLHLSNPYPNGLILPPGNSLGLANDIGYGAIGPLRNENRTPYEQTWTLGIEEQLPWKTLLDMEYIGKKGTHLYFAGANQLNILGPQVENASLDEISALQNYVPNPFYGHITDPNSILSSPQVQQYQLNLPYPQFTSATSDVPPIASSNYDAAQVRLQKDYSNGLQLLVSYVFSRSFDDASVDDDNVTWIGSFLSLQDPNKPYLERSLSTFDVTHVLQVSYVYALPFGRGKAFGGGMPRVLDTIFGGWVTNGVWRVSGGRPLNMTTYDGTSLPTYGAQRPNIVGTAHRNHAKGWINNYFTNPQVFVLPPLYALGNAPRSYGAVRTPFNFTTDLSVLKVFPLESLHKGASIEFRLEASNAFNHPTFGQPLTDVDDPLFGQITYTSSLPRQGQFGMKVTF
jgi:Carboxypeptidase regulatory-like domain/TonB dependent receptor